MSTLASIRKSLVGFFRQHARPLAILFFSPIVVATLYAFLAPKWYEAQLTVVPTVTKGAGSLLGGGSAFPLDLPLDVASSTSNVDRIAFVLNSFSVADAAIEKFDLRHRYRVRTIERARRVLWQRCRTKVEKRPAVVVLTCEDKSPETVKALTEYLGEVGNQVFGRVSISAAGDEREFLEKRVADARRDVDQASSKLREFQERNKIIDLGEQSKAVVSTMATLRAEVLAKQIQLSYLNSFSSRDEVTAGQLRQQIGTLEAKLRMLEEDRAVAVLRDDGSGKLGAAPTQAGRRDGRLDPANPDVFPPALSVPKLRYELEQLYREQKMQEALFLLLTQRYEMALVNEARDTLAFQILDHPTLPTEKSWPKRPLIMLVGFAFGLLLVGAWLLRVYGRALGIVGGGAADEVDRAATG